MCVSSIVFFSRFGPFASAMLSQQGIARYGGSIWDQAAKSVSRRIRDGETTINLSNSVILTPILNLFKLRLLVLGA